MPLTFDRTHSTHGRPATAFRDAYLLLPALGAWMPDPGFIALARLNLAAVGSALWHPGFLMAVAVLSGTAGVIMTATVLRRRFRAGIEHRTSSAEHTCRELIHRLEASQAASWTWDVVTNASRWDERFPLLYDLPADTPGSFATWLECVHPEDRPRIQARLEQMRSTVADDRWEEMFRSVSAAGRVRWHYGVGQAERDPDGRLVRLAGIDLDMTERRRDDETVRLFRALLDQSTDRIEVVDPLSGRLLDVNEASCRMLGYSRTELLGLTVMDIDPQVSQERFAEIGEALLKTGHVTLETQHRRKDGSTLPVEVSVSRVELDRSYAVAIVHDISDRKQREARLNLVDTALRAAPNSIMITDAQGTIEWVNPGFTHATGYSATEVVGHNPRLLKSGLQPDAFYANLWRTIASGENWRGELVNRRKDGSLLHEETTIAPVRDAGGRITHFVAIRQDVTDKRKLEEQFLRAQRMDSLGMLAAGIAHDLNNILAPVSMASAILRVNAASAADQRLLDTLEKCAGRGASLVRQILGFAHGVGGELRLVQVKHLLHDVIEVMAETFPKSIVLDVGVPNDLWPVLAHPTQIHQVLLNLCVNARDAMATGGTLRLRAENCVVEADAARALATDAKAGAWLVLHVEDTGTGIPSSVLEHMWEPFFTTKEAGKGTGLGLSTVRGIVEHHHGFITVQTRPGAGTKFRVYLPAAEEKRIPAAAESAASVESGHGEHILVVDDETFVRDTVAATLKKAGYIVISATDGADGIVRFSAPGATFALVLTDTDMPHLDGPGLARVVRSLKPATKIVAMSGMAENAPREHPPEYADGYLAKPFTVDTLLSTIEQVLRTRPGKGRA